MSRSLNDLLSMLRTVTRSGDWEAVVAILGMVRGISGGTGVASDYLREVHPDVVVANCSLGRSFDFRRMLSIAQPLTSPLKSGYFWRVLYLDFRGSLSDLTQGDLLRITGLQWCPYLIKVGGGSPFTGRPCITDEGLLSAFEEMHSGTAGAPLAPYPQEKLDWQIYLTGWELRHRGIHPNL